MDLFLYRPLNNVYYNYMLQHMTTKQALYLMYLATFLPNSLPVSLCLSSVHPSESGSPVSPPIRLPIHLYLPVSQSDCSLVHTAVHPILNYSTHTTTDSNHVQPNGFLVVRVITTHLPLGAIRRKSTNLAHC